MEIQIIIITLLFSGFFSGIEIAFVSANKLKFELGRQKGNISGRILYKFLNTPSHFLGTTLIGNNIALIFFGIMMAKVLEPLIVQYMPLTLNNEFLVMLMQTVLSTSLLLMVSEFLPKVLFRINANGILNVFSVPIYFFYYLFYPLVWLVVSIAHFIIKKVFRLEYEESKPVFSKLDLQEFVIKNGNNSHEDREINQKLFEKALHLINVKVRECMVPRTEIVAVEVSEPIENVKALFLDTKLSKIIVYEDTIDNILGYIHNYELFNKPARIRDVLYMIPVVPESMQARDLLNIFTREHKSIAHVVEEFGGTAGIVTLEDVLEEIFGEIQDEYDEEEFIEQQISETEYLFSGRLEIDYLNEKYGFTFPEGDYETLAGFLVTNYEDIPEMKEEILVDHYRFTILNVSDTRIETIKVEVLPAVETKPEES